MVENKSLNCIIYKEVAVIFGLSVCGKLFPHFAGQKCD